MIASTPMEGARYFVDLIGGAVVASGAIFVTSWLVRSAPEPARGALVIEAQESGFAPTASSVRVGEEAAVEAAGF
jgi:hypothetical protein